MKAVLEGGLEIEIPMHVGEMKWGDWCDFKQFETEYFEATLAESEEGQEGAEEKKVNVRSAIICLVEAIVCICGPDAKKLKFAIDKGEEKLVDEGYRIGFGDNISILKLYAHLVTIVESYKPETLDFNVLKIQIDKEVFQLDKARAAGVFGIDNMSVGEAIEILEFKRLSKESFKNKRVSFGNMDFSLGLRQLAVLLRKKGEELPWNKNVQDEFLERRGRLFGDHVTVEQVLHLRFFLINSFIESRTTLGINTSSTRPQSAKLLHLLAKRNSKGGRRRGKPFF